MRYAAIYCAKAPETKDSLYVGESGTLPDVGEEVSVYNFLTCMEHVAKVSRVQHNVKTYSITFVDELLGFPGLSDLPLFGNLK
jgi:hypothetical protein